MLQQFKIRHLVSEMLNHLTRRGIYLVVDLDQGLSGSKSMLLIPSSLQEPALQTYESKPIKTKTGPRLYEHPPHPKSISEHLDNGAESMTEVNTPWKPLSYKIKPLLLRSSKAILKTLRTLVSTERRSNQIHTSPIHSLTSQLASVLPRLFCPYPGRLPLNPLSRGKSRP